jgi:thioredoxin-related protein
MRWLLLAAALLFCALGARAQAPHPFAIEIPSWFAVSFLEIPEEVREAARAGKRVMVYFGQDGCVYCRRLMEVNFRQPEIVAKTRRHFVAIALDILGDREVQWTDGRRMSEKALTRALGIQFTPTLLFLDEKGVVVARLNGYYAPRRFDAALDYAAGLAGRGQRFEEFMQGAPHDPGGDARSGTQVGR